MDLRRDGEVELEMARSDSTSARESMFIPRNVEHVDASRPPKSQYLPTGRQNRRVLSGAGQIQRPPTREQA
jgi:hypothetical protein